MSTLTPPLGSPRVSIEHPSEGKALTKLQIIFTPGGSQVIKDNLLRVYENREYRIYGAYLTGVTAFRSGLEIIPSVGILLLNTATWFIDITSPRGDVITIFARDFTDIIHCIKTTIALPFFAFAGLIFPSDVFGLFKNMPGIQTTVDILGEKAVLANVKAKITSEEGNLTATAEELAEVQAELNETDVLLASKKDELEATLQQIEDSKDAAAEAASLTTQVRERTETLAKLRSEEDTASAKLASIRDEITRLGPVLEGARASNTAALATLESQHTAKKEELQSIQDQIKLAGEKQTATQAELSRLLTTVQDLTPKAATLRSDVERLKLAMPELIEQERVLREKIQSQKDEVKGLEATVSIVQEQKSRKLEEVRKQIAGWQIDWDERQLKLETLNRGLKDLTGKKDALDKQCKNLEFTTLHGLNVNKDSLGRELGSLGEKKAALEKEIAAQQKALRAETDAAKVAEGRVRELKTMIEGLELQVQNFTTLALPKLERQKTTLEEQKAALEGEVSAGQQKLEGVKTSLADADRELESLTRTLDLKRAEQANLEQTLNSIKQELTGSPNSSAAAGKSTSSKKTITTLQQQLNTLGTNITQAMERHTTLKASIADQASALIEKTQTVARLEKEASLLDNKVNGLKTQEDEMTSRLSSLQDKIAKFAALEQELQTQTKVLDLQARTSTESLKKITAQLEGLEAQVRIVEREKAVADKDFKTVSDQVATAQREKAELQRVIKDIKPQVESLHSFFETLENEKTKLDEALPKLKAEEQALIRQITDDNQGLTSLKETLVRTQETHAAEMQKLEEARTQAGKDKARLENDITVKNATRDALQSEFERLTASTNSLKGQETTLKDTVKAAEEAQRAAIARASEETEAQKKLQAQTLKLSAEVQALTLKSVAQAEANQKLDTEFETRRAAFEESLRLREQEASAALESKLQEIRTVSPAKAKLASPARPTTSSPETVAEDLKTADIQLRHKKRDLARTETAIKEGRAALDEIKQEITTYKEQQQKELAQIKAEKEQAGQALAATMSEADYTTLIKNRSEELARLRSTRFRLTNEVKQLRAGSTPGAPTKAAVISSGTGTEAKE